MATTQRFYFYVERKFDYERKTFKRVERTIVRLSRKFAVSLNSLTSLCEALGVDYLVEETGQTDALDRTWRRGQFISFDEPGLGRIRRHVDKEIKRGETKRSSTNDEKNSQARNDKRQEAIQRLQRLENKTVQELAEHFSISESQVEEIGQRYIKNWKARKASGSINFGVFTDLFLEHNKELFRVAQMERSKARDDRMKAEAELLRQRELSLAEICDRFSISEGLARKIGRRYIKGWEAMEAEGKVTFGAFDDARVEYSREEAKKLVWEPPRSHYTPDNVCSACGRWVSINGFCGCR